MADPMDREIGELLDRGGTRPRLSLDVVDGVLAMLVDMERQVDTLGGWGQPPGLFVMHGLMKAGVITNVLISQIDIPRGMWERYEQPVDLLEVLADRCETDHALAGRMISAASRIDPDVILVGFAFVAEGWLRKHDSDLTRSVHTNPELREDEVRSIYALDVDQRQYSVLRRRKAGTVTTQVITSQEYDRQIRTSSDPGARHVRETHRDGLPRIPRCLRRMLTALRDPGDPHGETRQ